MKTFLWSEIGGSDACRPSSSVLRGPDAFPLHRHDFPEVFWVSQGAGTHRINGTERPLNPGVLVQLRPADAHAFRSDAAGVHVRNIAIRPGVVAHIRKRYFLHDDTFWNAKGPRVPSHLILRGDQLQRLQAAFDELSAGPWNNLAAERFLLNLLYVIRPEPRPPDTAQPDMPAWLAVALARWRGDAKYFGEGGTAALARLACRSPEHVARTVRDCTGRTPTDYLNETRMNYAAQQLAVTDRKIIDIAMECGFLSLGHFYSVFHNAMGCAPRSYRMRFQPRPI